MNSKETLYNERVKVFEEIKSFIKFSTLFFRLLCFRRHLAFIQPKFKTESECVYVVGHLVTQRKRILLHWFCIKIKSRSKCVYDGVTQMLQFCI